MYVEDGFGGRGLGRAAMEAVLDIVGRQRFHLAVAGVTLPNDASTGLHLALGFRRVGEFEAIGWKLGAWHDVGWWQLALLEPGVAPPVPMTLPEAQAHPRWPAAYEAAIRRRG